MNPTFPNEVQNITLNESNLNQINPNQNISVVKKVTITKKQEQKQTGDSKTNYINNISSNNDPAIIKETKIVTQTFINPNDPQRFSFSGNSNLNINMNSLENKNNNKYILLIKKIANQLKRPVRAPTQGFFNFALQKGNYSLIIIRKISSQMINHQIEFNNDVFRIYIQKYKKYKELVKRIAHLLKISMKNKKYFVNILHEKNTNAQTINSNIEQSNLIKNNNLNNNNISQNYNEKKSSVKSAEARVYNNNRNTFNQKKTKTQSITQNNTNKTRYSFKNMHPNFGFNTNAGHERINLINPFFASKEKLSFNSNNLSNNVMKNNIQNQNQYFLNKKEKTINNKNKSKSPINESKNKNPKILNINLNRQQKNINNNQNQINIKNNYSIFNNKIEENQKEIKTNLNLELINKETITTSINQINEKKEIQNNFKESNEFISSISNKKNEQNTLTNLNASHNGIIANNSIINKMEDNSNDIEMKNNEESINILSVQNQKSNIINSSLINSNSLQKNSNNTNINIDIENKNKGINTNTNMSITNNYNSESNNNIIPIINKEENKEKKMSVGSNRSNGKEIKIKLSPFKKNEFSFGEEKNININSSSQKINIDNIQKLNCNTFSQIENNNLTGNDSIIYQKEISTSADELSFLKKFDSFLSKNNISVQSFIPMAFNENGQQYLKQNAFWEKYINYIYINYSVNNVKSSLFSFVHIIEQYFIWCENLTSEIVEEFIKLIIDIINKIYNKDEIKQFCSMNKINNFKELFEKYKIFMSDKTGNFKHEKEIEIKLGNKSQDECNCELCKNELACMKKLVELNKNKIIEVNIENLFYNGNKNKEEDKDKEKDDDKDDKEIEYKKTKTTYPPRKSRGSSAKKKVREKFSESKIKKSSEENFEYIAEEKKEKLKSKSKSKKRNSSMSKAKRESTNKKEKIEEDNKLDSYFKKEIKDEEKKSDSEWEISDKDNKKKIKNKKKEKSKRNKSYKEEKKDSNSQSEEEEKEEKETKNKKNKRKQKSKNKKRNKKYSDNESDDEDIKLKANKKKKKYPKD